jgi:hypothetical protein
MQPHSAASSSTVTLSQTCTSFACLATQEPWIIDSKANDHMIGNSGVLFYLQYSNNPLHVTLADGSTTSISGLGTANLSYSLSLACLIYP